MYAVTQKNAVIGHFVRKDSVSKNLVLSMALNWKMDTIKSSANQMPHSSVTQKKPGRVTLVYCSIIQQSERSTMINTVITIKLDTRIPEYLR